MDSIITAASCALTAGNALAALNYVALRNDAPALALRGIAMAQLGDLARAKVLMRKAARAFGAKNPVARARCIVAEAEIALVSRDLGWPARALEAARVILEARGDVLNAAHARYLEARRLLLTGHALEAEQVIAGLDPSLLPYATQVAHQLVVAGIAIRRMYITEAQTAISRAADCAAQTSIPGLIAEVENASRVLTTPAARLLTQGHQRMLLLQDVAALQNSDVLIVDACRHGVRNGKTMIALASRPVLFALAQALGEAWPCDVTRNSLITLAFRTRHVDESHRARLRVELGRLRKLLAPLAGINATAAGFVLTPHEGREIVVLARPDEEKHAAVLAFLADGEAWSSSALALALGTSQRTVQRALDALAAADKIQFFGHGRARRWVTPSVPGFTTTLLLPAPLLNG